MRKASDVTLHLSYIIVDPFTDKSEAILARLDMLEYEYMEAKICSNNNKLRAIYEYIDEAIDVMEDYWETKDHINGTEDADRYANLYHYYYLLRFIKNELDVTDLINIFVSNHVTPDSASINDESPLDIRILICLAASCNSTYREIAKASNLSESTVRERINHINKKYNGPENGYRFKIIEIDKGRRPYKIRLTKYGRLVLLSINPLGTSVLNYQNKIERLSSGIKIFESQLEKIDENFIWNNFHIKGRVLVDD